MRDGAYVFIPKGLAIESDPNDLPCMPRSSFETDLGASELSDDEIDVLDAISKLHRSKSVGYHFQSSETNKIIGRLPKGPSPDSSDRED